MIEAWPRGKIHEEARYRSSGPFTAVAPRGRAKRGDYFTHLARRKHGPLKDLAEDINAVFEGLAPTWLEPARPKRNRTQT
jgi:hypothetical protein